LRFISSKIVFKKLFEKILNTGSIVYEVFTLILVDLETA
jgi:hypothetical protein